MATILVADDDEPGRRYVATVLASQGHRILEAEDGMVGLELARSEHLDLVFTDLLMPRLDGYELAHQLRQEEAGGNVPVIFYSATYQEAEGRALAQQLDARVLVKPSEPRALLALVAKVLGEAARSGQRRPTRPSRPSEDFVEEHRRVLSDKLAKKAHELEVIRLRLEAMLSVATAAAHAPDSPDMVQIVCTGLREIIASRYAGVVIGPAAGSDVELWAASGLSDADRAAIGAHPSLDGIVGDVIRHGRAVRTARSGGRSVRNRSQLYDGHPEATSMLVVPIPFRSRRGALYLAGRLSARGFDAMDERIAVALAGHLATAYETHRLLGDLTATVARLEESQSHLEASERHFRMVLEASPDAIVGVDAGGLITYTNPQVARSFGYQPGELEGQPVDVLVPANVGDHARHRAAFIREPAARPMGLGLELRARRKDGTEFPVEISLSPVEAAEGLTVFATVTDITARQALAAKLIQAEKMESIGQLAGGVAHDFNNLLTVIGWYGELLQSDIASDDPRREYVDGIARAADRAASLTQQLLAFGRRQMLDVAPLDLNGQVGEVAPMLGRLLGENVELRLDLAEGLPAAMFDASRLEQVLVNLAVNARDAMPRGGRLTIGTGAESLDDRYGGMHGADVPPGQYVVLSVADTGIGMDAATRSRIFEPFFTTKGIGKGTGLGLSSVYGIVKQSNAFIWVYSEPGMGTTFKFYIPQANQAPDRSSPPPDAETPTRRSGTVLLVEDDPDVRRFVETALREQGYRVESAENPAVALERFDADPMAFDLLVTDVVMPGMTGPELAATIRSRRAIPTLFISGYADLEESDEVAATGARLLQKPFSSAALVAQVVELASQPGPARGRGVARKRRSETT